MGNDLTRITLTIQIKRSDAMMQYFNLKKWIDQGLTLVIVSGHTSYLKEVDLYRGSLTKRFAHFASLDGIKYFGLGIEMVHHLDGLGIDISGKVLELQGYQKMESSSVWAYYTGKYLSYEAASYLEEFGEWSARLYRPNGRHEHENQ